MSSCGVVYAEAPFLQQRHYGAYDFARLTDSDDRYLFRSFERIDSGSVASAGTALRWSVDYFVRPLTRSTPARQDHGWYGSASLMRSGTSSSTVESGSGVWVKRATKFSV
jgi:hypothetical protein